MSDTLPPGFQLDPAPQSGADLPPGFTLDAEDRAEPGGWAPTAVLRGLGNIVGTPRDMDDLMQIIRRGAVQGAETVVGNVAALGGRPNPVAGIADRMNAISDSLPRTVERLGLPTGQEAGATIMDRLGVQPVEAETPAGRVGSKAVELGVSALLPGRWPVLARELALGLGAGAGAGLAAEAGAGPAGQIAGALAVPGAAGGVAALRGSVGRSVERAMADITPAQADQAEALMREAQQRGVPLTAFEALQQVTGRNVDMQAVQRFLEQSAGGGPVLRETLQGREAGSRAAFGQARDEAGLSPPARPDLVPMRVQGAAGEVISAAERMRTNAVRPLYQRAAQEMSDPRRGQAVVQAVDDTVTQIDRIIQADQSGLLARRLGPLREALSGPNGPITDFESIDRARKYFRDLQAAPPTPDSPAIDKETAARVGNLLSQLGHRMARILPSYGEALTRYQRITNNIIDPLESGTVGRVSRTGSNAEQQGALLPSNAAGAAVPTDPAQVRRTFSLIRSRDPEAARDVLSLYLDNAFQEATKRTAAGPRETTGARFAASVVGTPEREAMLRAAIETTGGREAWAGFRRFLDVMEAQQHRAPLNSSTAANQMIRDQMSRGGMAEEGARAVTSLGRTLMDAWGDFRMGRNTEQYARLLTSPSGLARLRVLGRIDANSPAAEAVVVGLLSAAREGRAATQ